LNSTTQVLPSASTLDSTVSTERISGVAARAAVEFENVTLYVKA